MIMSAKSGQTMTKKQKQRLKKAALRSKEAFQQVMDMIREVEPTPYDFKNDRNGESFWTELLNQIPRDYPYDLSSYADRKLSADEVVEVVNKILNQFQDLIENKGLWKELWDENGKPERRKHLNGFSLLLFTVIARLTILI